MLLPAGHCWPARLAGLVPESWESRSERVTTWFWGPNETITDASISMKLHADCYMPTASCFCKTVPNVPQPDGPNRLGPAD